MTIQWASTEYISYSEIEQGLSKVADAREQARPKVLNMRGIKRKKMSEWMLNVRDWRRYIIQTPVDDEVSELVLPSSAAKAATSSCNA